MPNGKTPKLPLTSAERTTLRTAKIKLSDLYQMTGTQLAKTTAFPLDRCNYLTALAQFQSLGSVGHLMAEKIWRLGYTSKQHLAHANPTRMYKNYCRLTRCKADPCVEDVFRCAIAQAKYPNLPAEYRQWWAWTEHRNESEVEIDALVS